MPYPTLRERLQERQKENRKAVAERRKIDLRHLIESPSALRVTAVARSFGQMAFIATPDGVIDARAVTFCTDPSGETSEVNGHFDRDAFSSRLGSQAKEQVDAYSQLAAGMLTMLVIADRTGVELLEEYVDFAAHTLAFYAYAGGEN